MRKHRTLIVESSVENMESNKKIAFTDIVLVILGLGTAAFVVAVLSIFAITGLEPSTLVASFFAFITAEAAICWQIYAHKHKVQIKTDTDIAGDILAGLDITCDPNEGEG